jgi:hypothetical protein
MKTGPIIGCCGCIVFLVSFAIRDKEYEVTQFVLWLIAMCFLVPATILTGVQKGRPWLGVGLSLFSCLYGLGFFIVMLVPKKKSHNAA